MLVQTVEKRKIQPNFNNNSTLIRIETITYLEIN